MNKDSKIIITGASGLLGQNTILLLREMGYNHIVAIDKHHSNLAILKDLNPDVKIIECDLAEKGSWMNEFEGADVLLQLHAQITSLYLNEFERNNITATENVLDSAKKYHVPYIVHISSSVVISVANDYYTNTKKTQEKLVEDSGIPYCSLRPTLMFGWFDKKHLGWLSRFMKKTPVFPIPGNGKYLRQPLYARDMARVIISAMEMQPKCETYNIIGKEEIDYIDIIKCIKKVKGYRTVILCIPFWMFKSLMKFYALFSSHPPFTAQQLDALVAGDYFKGDPWWDIFNVESTPFDKAIEETFGHSKYSDIVLKP
ncbi:NAD-dependent epimerase/dehydratase family protein [Methanomicrobium mobile]|uniref:NAD-dependent epimerase/dehydratase family protein n=1 Tax=Methanomicrobium mobile TaxID=2205 RepID=UPI0005B2C450|nr:NAD(P)-dependent oxidoreductase [Methanomicrobium mobile]